MSVMIDPLLERQWTRDATAHPRVSDRSGHSVHGEPEARSRATGGPRIRVTPGRISLCVAVLLIPALYSYTIALTGPGSDSLQARTVEWARDHHLGPVVDRLENWYYTKHQAKVGGAPTVSVLPTVAPPPSVVGAAPPPTPGPTPLQTPADVPIPGEGVWSPLGPLVNGQAGAYVTSIRPDNVHTSSIDEVVNFDPKVFSFRAYPGTKIPKPWDRPDYVEPERRPSLVAAFSGGFRLRDSGGGMILGGTAIQPMKNGIATMSIDKNGVPNIGVWGRDIVDSSALDSARQNLDPIVDNGMANPDLLTDPNRKWGFTGPKNKTAVWRSGAGITADGHLIWVGGPGLTIDALAHTLIRAGAIRAMQLEINQEWVQLNTYSTNSLGKTSGKRLITGMQHTGNRWLTEDTRDFVAAFVRSP
jgi:hypothetical protein